MATSGDTGWSNPRILTLFILVFVSGMAIGAAGTRAFLHRRMMPQPVQQPPVASVKVLREQLQLTPNQERVIKLTLDDYAKYYDNIEMERQSVAEHGKQQILSVLNPDQQKRFLALFKTQPLPQ